MRFLLARDYVQKIIFVESHIDICVTVGQICGNSYFRNFRKGRDKRNWPTIITESWVPRFDYRYCPPIFKRVGHVTVTDGREGVCADPGKRDATLGTGEPAPPREGGGQLLVPDSGGGET
jgi:hypothetical protein